MRDIRPDLQSRLEEIKSERARLHRRLELLDRQAIAVQAVLDLEEAKWGHQEPLPGMNGAKPHDARLSSPLAIFLENALRDRPKSLDELKKMADQAGIELKGGGRSLHFALVGLQRNDYARRLPDERWEWMRAAVT